MVFKRTLHPRYQSANIRKNAERSMQTETDAHVLQDNMNDILGFLLMMKRLAVHWKNAGYGSLI